MQERPSGKRDEVNQSHLGQPKPAMQRGLSKGGQYDFKNRHVLAGCEC